MIDRIDISAGPPPARSPKLPSVIFGSSALGNLYEAPSDERKLAISAAWMMHGESPVLIDSAGKYGAGLALECIGNNLRKLGVAAESVAISNKLGWYRTPLQTSEPTFEPGVWVGVEHDAQQRISRQGIIDCWEQGNGLLGAPYQPKLVSVHDPDEFLAAAVDDNDRLRRENDLYDAYESLFDLKQRGEVQAVGVGAKDWRVAKQIAERMPLDWVMIANCLTIHTHPPELLRWIDQLASRGVTVINSAVFNAGFLVGGDFYNYRAIDIESSHDQQLLAWRKKFLGLCDGHGVRPAEACVQFGLSPPAVSSVALNTSNPDRVADCVQLANTTLPELFWVDAKRDGIIDSNFPYLP